MYHRRNKLRGFDRVLGYKTRMLKLSLDNEGRIVGNNQQIYSKEHAKELISMGVAECNDDRVLLKLGLTGKNHE